MLGFNVFAADSDEEARLLASSAQQAFVNLRSGRPGQLPPPVDGYVETLGPAEQALLQNVLSCAAIGAPAAVHERVEAFLRRTRADELMITAQVFDHAARRRSYELAAGVMQSLGAVPGAGRATSA
jgi:alkanesulfonate monooxygenase SsuD/methylene tetrahydromethanopterin reductase-like flavin-dependent oxidoreductase (luciferase family)